MNQVKFVHLQVHSYYSMSDGLYSVLDLINFAKKNGHVAFALSDVTNICALVKFYQAALKAGIKPIIATDIYLQGNLDQTIFKATLIAKNSVGFNNLKKLISLSQEKGRFFNKNIIDFKSLKNYASGLIMLNGGINGHLYYLLEKQNPKYLKAAIDFYKTNFLDSFYLEIKRTNRPNEEIYNQKILDLALEFDLPIVATNEVVFLKEDDFLAHEIRLAINQGITLEEKEKTKSYSKEQYFKNQQQMQELFFDLPSALENSVNIAKRANVFLTFGKYYLPNFPTGNLSEADYLIQESKKGLDARLEIIKKEKKPYLERLNIELEIINKMGFAGYFLIVAEFIAWSKDNNIPVGPGRGSGAGSLVAYALKITDLDPLEFDLLFERFLNPERVSMPDFDVDFCMQKRDLVIEHVGDIYGHGAVAQIITFGTMAAKAAVRDVARALGKPYSFADKISKLIPLDIGMTLDKALKEEQRFLNLYNQDQEAAYIIDRAKELEGVVRNAGKHAGGVVISPTTICDFAPLYCDDEGNNPVTQFDKNDVESAGLVKFDFLGLKTLTVIKWTIDLIKTNNPNFNLDIEKIPLDDAVSFNLLKSAKTTAVFQLESSGMKDLIKRLKPDCFEDIIALVALFRPGPLQSGMVDNFIARKHGLEQISYPDEKYQHLSLKEILEPTYGIILYQEQVMQIAQILSGYSLGQADLLRRAMGKKKPEEMAKQRDVFKEGALKNNIDPDLSMKIFDLVEKFAGYGFNKSHSAAYALIAYQTLYLKTHFAPFFMAAVMSADMDNTDKIITFLEDAKRFNLVIKQPNINQSSYYFSVDKEQNIIYGLGALKGIGEIPANEILKARKNGDFLDLFDFCKRVDTSKCNKRVLEALIKSGAMNCFSMPKAILLANIAFALKQAEQDKKDKNTGQNSLFFQESTSPKYIKPSQNLTLRKLLEYEKEIIGCYFSKHILATYSDEIKLLKSKKINSLKPTKRGQTELVLAQISKVYIKKDKKMRPMAIVSLEDTSGKIEALFFANSYLEFSEMLIKNSVCLFEVEVRENKQKDELSLFVSKITTMANIRAKLYQNITLSFDNIFYKKIKENLNKILLQYKVKDGLEVKIVFKREDISVIFELRNLTLDLTDDCLEELFSFLSSKHIYLDKKLHLD